MMHAKFIQAVANVGECAVDAELANRSCEDDERAVLIALEPLYPLGITAAEAALWNLIYHTTRNAVRDYLTRRRS